MMNLWSILLNGHEYRLLGHGDQHTLPSWSALLTTREESSTSSYREPLESLGITLNEICIMKGVNSKDNAVIPAQFQNQCRQSYWEMFTNSQG